MNISRALTILVLVASACADEHHHDTAYVYDYSTYSSTRTIEYYWAGPENNSAFQFDFLLDGNCYHCGEWRNMDATGIGLTVVVLEAPLSGVFYVGGWVDSYYESYDLCTAVQYGETWFDVDGYPAKSAWYDKDDYGCLVAYAY